MTELLRQLGTLTAGQVAVALVVAGALYLSATRWRRAQRKWVHHRVDEAWGGAVGPLEKAHAGLAARLGVLEERVVWLIERLGGAEKAARAAHERLDGRGDRSP